MRSGLCPNQANNIKCCLSETPSEDTEAERGSCSNDNKEGETLNRILGNEGGCQNWASDTGNTYQGRRGYTCMGITPEVGHRNRNKFTGCSGFSGPPADFVKWCYDRSPSKFKEGAISVYRANYFNVCNKLGQPAYYVCCDISVNSGPARARRLMAQLGSPSNMKSFARQLNEKHRQFYRSIAESRPSQNKFLKGWLNRAAARDRFIESC